METAHLIPEKSWLEGQWFLPPRGLGRSDTDIALDLGVNKHTVENWRKKLGIHEPANIRIAYHRSGNGISRIAEPDQKWLEEQYLKPPRGLGKSVEEIANELGVYRRTVSRWINLYGIHETHSQRHSDRMSGANNPAFKGGHSRSYHKRLLSKEQEAVCEWCGFQGKVQVHHRDHNIKNGEIGNLGWLCQHCNLIEAHLYGLIKEGHATAIIEPRKRIVIEFKSSEDK